MRKFQRVTTNPSAPDRQRGGADTSNLRQSPRSVRERCERGEIPALRVGSGPRAPFRIDQDELAAWLYSDPKETAR